MPSHRGGGGTFLASSSLQMQTAGLARENRVTEVSRRTVTWAPPGRVRIWRGVFVSCLLLRVISPSKKFGALLRSCWMKMNEPVHVPVPPDRAIGSTN
jgi:hypothetical protein